jgi:hypothetical protein
MNFIVAVEAIEVGTFDPLNLLINPIAKEKEILARADCHIKECLSL